METPLQITMHPHGVVVAVRAQTKARQNAVVRVRDGMLCVAVTAVPEKGKANKAIADTLSKALRVPKSAVTLVSGETSTQKRFLITGGSTDQIAALVDRL